MAAENLSTNKLLPTAEVARDLGVQPDVFLKHAAKAGVQPRKRRGKYLWSEADRDVVRATLESAG